MRYVTKPKNRIVPVGGHAEPEPLLPALTVYEEPRGPEPTGLLNHEGLMIYRMPDPIKMGY